VASEERHARNDRELAFQSERFLALDLLTDVSYLIVKLGDDDLTRFALEHIGEIRNVLVHDNEVPRPVWRESHRVIRLDMGYLESRVKAHEYADAR